MGPPAYDSSAKVNPPLRTPRDVEALIQGLNDGTIDAIATDHAPHALAEKEGEFDQAAFGVVGLETAASLLLDRLVRPGLVKLSALISRLTVGPAKIFGLPGGTLTVGTQADVTILDLERELTIEPERFHSKGRNTPFRGWTVKGMPWMTIVGGKVVMWEHVIGGGVRG